MNWQKLAIFFITAVAVFYLLKRVIQKPEKSGCDKCHK
jgi:hypothetical protein